MKIAAFCLWCVLTLTAQGAMAQQPTTPNQSSPTPNQSWDPLRQLQAGEKLEVERKTVKKKVSGKVVGISDTELVIKRGRRDESISRDEVKNIWRVTPPGLKKRLIFAAIGAAVGTLSMFITYDALDVNSDDTGALLAAPLWFAVPAILSEYAISRKGKRRLIYSAP
ncbi:MAG TPA: hypothetical protein VG324_05120 [Blastocatellia bacterium]|nr:hypothetical protein [Blastocatellia bacterium]